MQRLLRLPGPAATASGDEGGAASDNAAADGAKVPVAAPVPAASAAPVAVSPVAATQLEQLEEAKVSKISSIENIEGENSPKAGVSPSEKVSDAGVPKADAELIQREPATQSTKQAVSDTAPPASQEVIFSPKGAPSLGGRSEAEPSNTVESAEIPPEVQPEIPLEVQPESVVEELVSSPKHIVVDAHSSPEELVASPLTNTRCCSRVIANRCLDGGAPQSPQNDPQNDPQSGATSASSCHDLPCETAPRANFFARNSPDRVSSKSKQGAGSVAEQLGTVLDDVLLSESSGEGNLSQSPSGKKNAKDVGGGGSPKRSLESASKASTTHSGSPGQSSKRRAQPSTGAVGSSGLSRGSAVRMGSASIKRAASATLDSFAAPASAALESAALETVVGPRAGDSPVASPEASAKETVVELISHSDESALGELADAAPSRSERVGAEGGSQRPATVQSGIVGSSPEPPENHPPENQATDAASVATKHTEEEGAEDQSSDDEPTKFLHDELIISAESVFSGAAAAAVVDRTDRTLGAPSPSAHSHGSAISPTSPPCEPPRSYVIGSGQDVSPGVISPRTSRAVLESVEGFEVPVPVPRRSVDSVRNSQQQQQQQSPGLAATRPSQLPAFSRPGYHRRVADYSLEVADYYRRRAILSKGPAGQRRPARSGGGSGKTPDLLRAPVASVDQSARRTARVFPRQNSHHLQACWTLRLSWPATLRFSDCSDCSQRRPEMMILREPLAPGLRCLEDHRQCDR